MATGVGAWRPSPPRATSRDEERQRDQHQTRQSRLRSSRADPCAADGRIGRATNTDRRTVDGETGVRIIARHELVDVADLVSVAVDTVRSHFVESRLERG